MLRPLVITRPQPEAAHWVAQLQAAGQPALALPMMQIGPCTSAAAQAAARAAQAQLDHFDAIMFVSVNAVRYFMPLLANAAQRFPAQARAWAPGPGTAQALQQHGIPTDRIDQPRADARQFDSESLWEQVQAQVTKNHRILVVRGSDAEQSHAPTGQGRQWLTQQLEQAGASVSFAPVYERQATPPSPALRQTIEDLRAQHAIWLLSSSECTQHLINHAHGLTWQHATALATHPRIAQHAKRLGFGHVIDTKPAVQSIVSSIESLNDL